MATLTGVVKQSQGAWELPPVKPLNEAVWNAWKAKGRAEDRRSSAALMKAVKWVSILALLITAALWSQLAPFAVVVRFIVTGSAIAVMLQAFQARRFALAVLFAALVVLYNPAAPPFAFAGDWQRVLVAVSAVPFAASLAWRHARMERND